MKTVLASVIVLLASINASATSYASGAVAGYFGWSAAQNSGYWTVRIPDLDHNGYPPYGEPYMYPTGFGNALLSVTCNPLCAIGDKFSIDLTMTNFKALGGPPNLDMFVGTLNLVTNPIVLTSSSGTAIAHFNLTGNLEACTDSTCSTELFALAVNVHSYLRMTYSYNGGQLSISSVTYVLPEPSSMALLGTGLAFAIGKFGQSVRRRST